MPKKGGMSPLAQNLNVQQMARCCAAVSALRCAALLCAVPLCAALRRSALHRAALRCGAICTALRCCLRCAAAAICALFCRIAAYYTDGMQPAGDAECMAARSYWQTTFAGEQIAARTVLLADARMEPPSSMHMQRAVRICHSTHGC